MMLSTSDKPVVASDKYGEKRANRFDDAAIDLSSDGGIADG